MTETKSSRVKFTDNPPPGPRKQAYDWAKIAAKLRGQPGKWGQITKGDRLSLVTAFRLGGYKDLPPDEFEVRTENTTRGITKKAAAEQGIAPQPRLGDMYLRYVGPNKEYA